VSSSSSGSSTACVGASAVDAIQADLPFRPYYCYKVIEVCPDYYDRCRQMKVAYDLKWQ
jgi:hypothetical protein